MFSRFFSNVTEPIRKNILENIYSKNTNAVVDLLDINNIDVNDYNLVDELKNTPLHLAVATKNSDLTSYLVTKGINKQKKNIFGETAFLIALKNQDETIIRTLITTHNQYQADELAKEIERHKRSRDEFEKEKSEHQHTRVERDIAICDNDLLRTENKKLKDDNVELRKTVRTLRQSLKK